MIENKAQLNLGLFTQDTETVERTIADLKEKITEMKDGVKPTVVPTDVGQMRTQGSQGTKRKPARDCTVKELIDNVIQLQEEMRIKFNEVWRG